MTNLKYHQQKWEVRSQHGELEHLWNKRHSDSGHFVYEFQNGDLVKKEKFPNGQLMLLFFYTFVHCMCDTNHIPCDSIIPLVFSVFTWGHWRFSQWCSLCRWHSQSWCRNGISCSPCGNTDPGCNQQESEIEFGKHGTYSCIAVGERKNLQIF